MKKRQPKIRSPVANSEILRGGAGAGPHQNNEYDVKKGRSRKKKHKKENDE